MRRAAEIIAPYIAWLVLITVHLSQPATPDQWIKVLWLVKCLAGAYLILFVPGLQLTVWVRQDKSSRSRIDGMFLGFVINIYFLLLYATALKYLYGSLAFVPLVTGWFFCTVIGTALFMIRSPHGEVPALFPRDLGKAWIVIVAVSIMAIWMADSKGVDEEQWFCDKFVDPGLFQDSLYTDEQNPSEGLDLVPISGHRIVKPEVYLLIDPTMRLQIENRNPEKRRFPLRLILHNDSPFAVEIYLSVDGIASRRYRLQRRYDITEHGYGYPPANLLIDEVIEVPPGSTSLELTVEADGKAGGEDLGVTLYNLSGLTLAQTRERFSKHFVYGDVADEREMINLVRDFRSHLFPYQRFYNDEVGAPGVDLPPEERRGGPYWNNLPLHPFIGSIFLVLVEDTKQTFTAMSIFQTVLLFFFIVAATHKLGWKTEPLALILLALSVFAYFSFVRPGIESSTRQPLSDILFVLCLVHLLTFHGIRFLASAALFILTNFTGFGLLVVMLFVQLVATGKRRYFGGCLAAVMGFQFGLNLLVTWVFIAANQVEYWSSVQAEWWNRYSWLSELIRSGGSDEWITHAGNSIRVIGWAVLGTFLFPLVRGLRWERESFLLPATFYLYTIAILFMEKPRGHYLSTLIVIAAIGGLPIFRRELNQSRLRRMIWAVGAVLGILMCYYHSKLYLYTEDYLLPLFPAASLLEKVFFYF